ncbi:MAG: hypothetical protein MUF28_13250 [Ignavibacterium sp.]|jgi:hypothetical protein|nr:hypothetical protein [Ignavibacterium sp.]
MRSALLSLIGIILLSFFMISCSDDDPVTPQSDHFEAEGIVFLESGIKIADIFRGVTTDTLFAPKGGQTSGIDVKFYNSNKEMINPPNSAEQTLAWEIDNPNLVGVWQHPGEEGGFEFHLRGLVEGITQMEFFVMHEGHADFRSGKITIKVEFDPNAHGEPVGLKLYDEGTGTLLVTVKEDSSVVGALITAAGVTTDHIEVQFFDENNVEFQPDAIEHTINIISANTSIASITGLDPAEPFAFKVQGVSVGNTTLTIELLHNSIVEKTFLNIPVIVQ